MPAVQVSSEFLPSVMAKVHVHHARANIKLRLAISYAIGLLVLSIGFFVWDVLETRDAMGLTDASEAFHQKLQILMADTNSSFSQITGILAASWQLVTGLVSVAVEPGNLPYLIGILLGTFILAYGIKRWISSLHIMDR